MTAAIIEQLVQAIGLEKVKTDDGTIIHRVIDTGRDKEGTYYITKGDNNPVKDSEKVRFNQIKGLLIAIIY